MKMWEHEVILIKESRVFTSAELLESTETHLS